MTSPAATAEPIAGAGYDAFLSYAHRDRDVSTAIQKGLHQIGRRLGQLRALRVFRDDTNLAASPDLWARISDALDASRFMIVVLSPQSAASHWVNEEIRYWLAHRGHDHLMLVLAEGELHWDYTQERFDPVRSNAAPAALTAPGSLPVEPLYIDVSVDAPWDLRSPLLRDKLTALAAPIHGKAKDQLSGDDVREQRRFNRLRAAAGTVLALSTVVATVAAVVAVNKQHQADARLRDAVVARLNAEGASMLAGLMPGGDQRALQELLAANAIKGNGVPILDAQIARFTTQKIVNIGSRPNRLSYSPDGRRIATGQFDGTVRQWDSTLGTQVGPAARGQTNQVVDVAYTTDGRAIFAVGADGLRLLNATTGVTLDAPAGVRFQGSVAANPDGSTVISAGPDDTVNMWDSRTGKLLKSFPAFDQPEIPNASNFAGLSDVTFDNTGTRMAVSRRDGLIGIYDGATGDPQPPLLHVTRHTGNPAAISQIAFSPDGRTLAVAAEDLQFWDLDTRTLTRRIQVDQARWAFPSAVAFSPDGLRVVTGRLDGALQLWDASTGAQLGTTMTGHTAQVQGIAFRPDGRQLASTSIDGTLRLWNATTGQLMRGDETLGQVAFSPDGRRVAALGDYLLHQWDLDSGLPLMATLLFGVETNSWFHFVNDLQAMIAQYDGSVMTVNLKTGKPVRPTFSVPVPHDGGSNVYALSADGRTLAWGSRYGHSVNLTDARTGRLLGQPMTAAPSGDGNAYDSTVGNMAFSPDGHQLIVGYDDGIRVWNTDSRKLDGQAMTDPGPANDVAALAVNHDGTTVAAGFGDGTIVLWDLATRKQRPHGRLQGHATVIQRLAFGPGHQLASVSADSTLRLWDTATGAPATTPMELAGAATGLAVSNDGRLVASTTLEGEVLLSPAIADPQQLCDKLPANLTHTQWREWVSPGIPYITVCPKLPTPQD